MNRRVVILVETRMGPALLESLVQKAIMEYLKTHSKLVPVEIESVRASECDEYGDPGIDPMDF